MSSISYPTSREVFFIDAVSIADKTTVTSTWNTIPFTKNTTKGTYVKKHGNQLTVIVVLKKLIKYIRSKIASEYYLFLDDDSVNQTIGIILGGIVAVAIVVLFTLLLAITYRRNMLKKYFHCIKKTEGIYLKSNVK